MGNPWYVVVERMCSGGHRLQEEPSAHQVTSDEVSVGKERTYFVKSRQVVWQVHDLPLHH